MISSKGYAAHESKKPLAPFAFERRDPRPHDVAIDIHYCGVCHSDLHQVRDEWGGSSFPMVPGHEIVGVITHVGSAVEKFRKGDLVGVGCMVDSCRSCQSCDAGLEQYCENGFTGTYNGKDRQTKQITFGGYSNNIVVDENFVLRISDRLAIENVAPLLCAGITTYSPLRHWGVSPGQEVAIVGLGGLGHMGVKFAHSFGAKVTVFTTSGNKREDALRLGANRVVVSKDQDAMSAEKNRFDFILNTVSAPHDINQFLGLLKRDGTMVCVGIPDKAPELQAFPLIAGRRAIAGSLIGGIKETQEMLDYCAANNITSDCEIIPIQKINEAFERMLKADVKYRFVIDMKSLK